MRKLAAALAIAGMAVVGCGGDDDDGGGGDVSEEEQPYVDALAASFTAGEEGDLVVSQEQADCIAPRWIDTIGLDRLEEAGVTPEEIGDDDDQELADLGLSEEEGGELFDAFGACDVDITDLFIASMGDGGELSDEDRECLEGEIDDDLIRRILVGIITKGEDSIEADDEIMSEFFAAFAECPGAAN